MLPSGALSRPQTSWVAVNKVLTASVRWNRYHTRKLTQLDCCQHGFAVAAHGEIGCSGATENVRCQRSRGPCGKIHYNEPRTVGFLTERRPIDHGFFSIRKHPRIGQAILRVNSGDWQILLPACVRPEAE